MSNQYYNYSNTLIPGQVARAEDVAAELEGAAAGFGLLPTPRSDGLGFASSFLVPPATQDGEVATWGQLVTLEQSAQAAKEAAALSETAAAASEANAGLSEVAAAASETAAALSQANAAASEALAQQWATENEDVEVEIGLFSAKHWAKKAEQITSGARAYQGTHDASGGTYPIATPAAGDEGKYWLISVAGTLPVGPATKGDELAINASLGYEIINLSAVYAQKSQNLSDLDSASAARTNLGLGSAALITASAYGATLLDDADAATARTTLGLGTAAVEAVGTGANQVPKRDGSGAVPGNITGNAATATNAANATLADAAVKWQNARTLSLTGDVTGSVNIDGTANAAITAALSASAVLSKLKTVDGSGSGLDADLLDGVNSSEFLKKTEFDPANAAQVWSGSSASVAMTSLSEGGDGVYLVQFGTDFLKWSSSVLFVRGAVPCSGSPRPYQSGDNLDLSIPFFNGSAFAIDGLSFNTVSNAFESPVWPKIRSIWKL